MTDTNVTDAAAPSESDMLTITLRDLTRTRQQKALAEGAVAMLRAYLVASVYRTAEGDRGETIVVCTECGAQKGKPHGNSHALYADRVGQPCRVGQLLADNTLASKAGEVIARARYFAALFYSPRGSHADVSVARESLRLAVEDLDAAENPELPTEAHS